LGLDKHIKCNPNQKCQSCNVTEHCGYWSANIVWIHIAFSKIALEIFCIWSTYLHKIAKITITVERMNEATEAVKIPTKVNDTK
jgi:hypothetical protein